MNIKRARQEIINTIRAYLAKDEDGEYRIPSIRQRPVLLMGPPGIGKTQIMEQIAGECDLALVAYTITHHTRQSAIGLPFIVQKEYGGVERSVTEYTMSEIIASVYDRMEASGKREGILFIDEINCVSETLAPTMLQFLQGKTFGNQAVPKGWIIVAAGNPQEYNRSVREFDVVTLDRVKVIQVEPDFAVWKEYAYQAGIHPGIISYLDLRRDQFYRMETTVDGKNFVTARGWQDLSELIYAYERMGLTVDREVAVQYLQYPAVAKDFANYLELFTRYRSDYQIEEILSGTIRPGILNRLKFAPFDERAQVVSLVLAGLSETFRQARETDRCTQELYTLLMSYREAAAETKTGGEMSPAETDGAGTDAAETDRAETDAAETDRAETVAAIPDRAWMDGTKAVRQPAIRLQALADQKREAEENRVRAGQNDRARIRSARKVLETLDLWVRELQLSGAEEEAAWAYLKERFGEKEEERVQTLEKAQERLEYAFDFMEAAYGESQEMVLFITELSVNPDSAWYLRENDCPRYFMYNKSLLFEGRDAGIRKELDAIRDLQIT